MRPLLAVVFGEGSATAMDVGVAADGLCDLAFVCDPRSAYVERSLPVLESVGEVVPPGDVGRVARTLGAMDADGVVAFGEPELAVAAELAARLDLAYHSPETALLLADKHLQRARLAACGVDAVRFAEVPLGDGGGVVAVCAAVARVGLPAVLKPRRGSGSRSTVLVRTEAECVAAAAEAFGRGESALVLEERLCGDESVAGPGFGDYVSVESLACGDRHVLLGVTGKPPLAEPFRETGAFFPSTVGGAVAERAFAVASDALRALGVRHGVCHTELKLTASGPRLIEVNGRLGGYVDDVVSRATGESPLRLALAAALGRAEPAPWRAEAVAYQLFPMPPVGARTLVSVGGVEEARELPGVLRVELARQPGDAVDWREGTGSRAAVVAGEAPDHAALLEVWRRLEETLVVEYAL